MSIEQAIRSWDGKSSSDIQTVYESYRGSDSFVENTIQLFSVTELQKGATWLLKRYFEEGNEIESCHVSNIVRLLPSFESWETKLHLLQCIPYIEIGSSEKKTVELFLRNCLISENKFVRAWAYNGFYLLSLQHSEYVEEDKLFLELAMKDEAPSVKARIRNILKKGF